jgi:hypothetical protein
MVRAYCRAQSNPTHRVQSRHRASGRFGVCAVRESRMSCVSRSVSARPRATCHRHRTTGRATHVRGASRHEPPHDVGKIVRVSYTTCYRESAGCAIGYSICITAECAALECYKVVRDVRHAHRIRLTLQDTVQLNHASKTLSKKTFSPSDRIQNPVLDRGCPHFMLAQN